MCKPILHYPVDVKSFLRKELNKSNIPQKLEFFLACESDQKLSPLTAAKELTIKATSLDEQEHIALPAKNLQRQAQNLNIVHKKAKEAQEVVREPKDKTCSCFYSLSSA